MSDEVSSGRLSQIFDSLTNLHQQQHQNPQQQQTKVQQKSQLKQQKSPQQQQQERRRRSTSSSPSPSPLGSGRATPVGVKQQQQPRQQYTTTSSSFTAPLNYYLRYADCAAAGHGCFVPSGTQTFPSATSQAHHHHLLPAHYYQQHFTSQQQYYIAQSSQEQQQQQQTSLPPLLYDSQSLNASPLLGKRATSFSGNMPLTRLDSAQSSSAATVQTRCSLAAAVSLISSQSTPNSPRLMPRRSQRAPPIPVKPSAAQIAAASVTVATTTNAAAANNLQSTTATFAQNSALAALDADAPWPHFSAITEHLDVHQLNNYAQGVPEINWQERCLELQLELHRSKSQAGRIRDMLREKVSL